MFINFGSFCFVWHYILLTNITVTAHLLVKWQRDFQVCLIYITIVRSYKKIYSILTGLNILHYCHHSAWMYYDGGAGKNSHFIIKDGLLTNDRKNLVILLCEWISVVTYFDTSAFHSLSLFLEYLMLKLNWLLFSASFS